MRVAAMIDLLTPHNGTRVPEYGEKGYLVRQLAEGVQPTEVETVLAGIAHVTYKPTMPLDQVIKIAGQDAFFRPPVAA
jgi:hypothetical protein